MIALDNAGTRALSLITAQNGADVFVSFSDYTTATEVYARGVPTLTTVASATTTSICATPASGVIRDVDYVNIKNTFAGSHSITVQITSGAGGPFVLRTIALLTNESLEYTHGTGWTAMDANGNRKEVTASVFASITDSGLTSGRVVIAGTAGLLGDDADLTFSVNTLTAHTLTVSTGALNAQAGTFATTLGVTGASTQARINASGVITTTGTLPDHAASRTSMDHTTGFGRLFTNGPNATTNDGFQILSYRSDGSNFINLAEWNAAGGLTLPGTLTVTAGNILRGSATQDIGAFGSEWRTGYFGTSVGIIGTVSGTGVLAVGNGTAPTAQTDTVGFYSTDIAAGHTEPSFFCEGTQVLATGQADSASSVRVKMRINGTEVTLLAI